MLSFRYRNTKPAPAQPVGEQSPAEPEPVVEQEPEPVVEEPSLFTEPTEPEPVFELPTCPTCQATFKKQSTLDKHVLKCKAE